MFLLIPRIEFPAEKSTSKTKKISKLIKNNQVENYTKMFLEA